MGFQASLVVLQVLCLSLNSAILARFYAIMACLGGLRLLYAEKEGRVWAGNRNYSLLLYTFYIYSMAELIISPKQRWLPMPHIIKINHRVLGVVKGRDVRVQMPAGTYTIGVQSGLRFIESEVHTHIYEQAENRLVFSDRERWWNLLFNIDL